MAGFFEDKEGTKSSKRLNQFIAVMSGSIIGQSAAIIALIKSSDVGPNTVAMVLGLVGLGVAGGVGTAIANKGTGPQ